MDGVQQILETEAIKRLKARYFRCLDTKDWEAWADVFTDDAMLKFDLAVSTMGRNDKPAPEIVGRKAIMEQVSGLLAAAQTVHHGHHPEIDFISEHEARGIWAMEDIVDHGHTVIHGFGHYRETYLKVDGMWRISSSHLTRIRLSQVVRDQVHL